MTKLETAMTTTRCPSRRSGSWIGDLHVVGTATMLALGAWALWTGTGDRAITVRSGADVHQIGAGSVGAIALLASVAGVLVLRLLVAKLRNGLRWWTVGASAVLAISMLGPLGATNVPDGLVLLSLHGLVGVIVILGLRSNRRVWCAPDDVGPTTSSTA